MKKRERRQKRRKKNKSDWLNKRREKARITGASICARRDEEREQ
jgi:hypothetical protein